MTTPLNKLLSLWLALALTLVPLPVFASAVNAGGCDHGRMEQVATQADPAPAACKHCQSHQCEDGSCAQQDCSSCFSNLINTAVFSFGNPSLTEHPASPVATGLLSRSDPPPLRPPL